MKTIAEQYQEMLSESKKDGIYYAENAQDAMNAFENALETRKEVLKYFKDSKLITLTPEQKKLFKLLEAEYKELEKFYKTDLKPTVDEHFKFIDKFWF